MKIHRLNSNDAFGKLRSIGSLLAVAALILWVAWPRQPGIDPHDLSRADGRPRFWATTYSKRELPPNLTWRQRLGWVWMEYQRRHGKPNPTAWSFPVTPVQPCSIEGLLNQCMEVSGTHYLVAVEIAGGGVQFGSTNVLNGAQWVAAFEHALETNSSVLCYDYAKKRNFEDSLLLIREGRGLVKVVPRSKLAEYRKAGLVKSRPP